MRKPSHNKSEPTKGEKLLIDIFKTARVPFEREYTFDDLHGRKGTLLRYDFALFDDNKNLIALCEWDGVQHFQQVKCFQPHRQDFQRTQGHDRTKNSYALAHNIPLYRIPYWEYDNIHTLKDIFTEKHRVVNKFHNDDLTPP